MGFFSSSSSSSKNKVKDRPTKQHSAPPTHPPTHPPPPDIRISQQREDAPPAMPPRPSRRRDSSASTPGQHSVQAQSQSSQLQVGAPVTIHNHYYITHHHPHEQQHPYYAPPPHPPPQHLCSTSHNSPQNGAQHQYTVQQQFPPRQQYAPSSQHNQSQPQYGTQLYLSPEPQSSSQFGANQDDAVNVNGPDPSRLKKSRRVSKSMMNLAKATVQVPNCGASMSAWYEYGSQVASTYVTAYDEMFGSFNNVMKLDERMTESQMDLPVSQHAPPPPPSLTNRHPAEDGQAGHEGRSNKGKQSAAGVAAAVVTGSYFSKAERYSNSRLPPNLPPFAVYMPTWPLLTLAAQHSMSVYNPTAAPQHTESHVPADWRTGAKAMSISSVPMDSMNTVVFAIRGTASLMDWVVNLKHTAASPEGFLDDEGNLCHAGFLSVAKKMVKGVAARLKQLLDEDPGRARYSLLLTGHSAGGAVASLLYCHMLAQSEAASSELNKLTGCFKRVHCVTFGTPPVSLLPLQKPNCRKLRNSIFLSFVNEGDPVTRVDKGYIKTLLDLLASNVPGGKPKARKEPRSKEKRATSLPATSPNGKPTWIVPPCTLSNPGRVVVLRSARWDTDARPNDHKTMRERLEEGVVAHVIDEDQLRGVIWADPVAHLMRLYAGRIESLAVAAVMAQGRITDGNG